MIFDEAAVAASSKSAVSRLVKVFLAALGGATGIGEDWFWADTGRG
jgi:hypothetical protein